MGFREPCENSLTCWSLSIKGIDCICNVYRNFRERDSEDSDEQRERRALRKQVDLFWVLIRRVEVVSLTIVIGFVVFCRCRILLSSLRFEKRKQLMQKGYVSGKRGKDGKRNCMKETSKGKNNVSEICKRKRRNWNIFWKITTMNAWIRNITSRFILIKDKIRLSHWIFLLMAWRLFLKYYHLATRNLFSFSFLASVLLSVPFLIELVILEVRHYFNAGVILNVSVKQMLKIVSASNKKLRNWRIKFWLKMRVSKIRMRKPESDTRNRFGRSADKKTFLE